MAAFFVFRILKTLQKAGSNDIQERNSSLGAALLCAAAACLINGTGAGNGCRTAVICQGCLDGLLQPHLRLPACRLFGLRLPHGDHQESPFLAVRPLRHRPAVGKLGLLHLPGGDHRGRPALAGFRRGSASCACSPSTAASAQPGCCSSSSRCPSPWRLPCSLLQGWA